MKKIFAYAIVASFIAAPIFAEEMKKDAAAASTMTAGTEMKKDMPMEKAPMKKGKGKARGKKKAEAAK